MLIVTPSLKGHFPHYISIIKERHENTQVVVLNGKVRCFFILFYLLIFTKPRKVLFLHGEINLISLIVSRLFSKDVRAIFYYCLFTVDHKPQWYIAIAKALLKLLKCIGIRAFYLELPVGQRLGVFGREMISIFSWLPDPILINSGSIKPASRIRDGENKVFLDVKESETRLVNVLIPGYLDSRKSILEILDAIQHINHEAEFDFKVTLMGEIDKDIVIEPKGYSFDIDINEGRYSDEELEFKILSSDLVCAIYEEHYGSSGIVLNSFFLKVPVLFVPKGVLKSFCNVLEFKNLPRNNSYDEVIKAIESFLGFYAERLFYNDELLDLFLDRRTKENFLRRFIDE